VAGLDRGHAAVSALLSRVWRASVISASGGDARRGADAAGGQVERGGECLIDALREGLDVFGGGEVFAQDDELVAGHPRQSVAGSQQPGEPVRDCDQQRIADRVSVGVVDLFGPSRSANSTAACAWLRRARSAAWSSRCCSSTRFGRPVSPSCSASSPEPFRGCLRLSGGSGVQQVGGGDVRQGLRRGQVPGGQSPGG